jgi:hypothetical protein
MWLLLLSPDKTNRVCGATGVAPHPKTALLQAVIVPLVNKLDDTSTSFQKKCVPAVPKLYCTEFAVFVPARVFGFIVSTVEPFCITARLLMVTLQFATVGVRTVFPLTMAYPAGVVENATPF